MEPPFRVGGGEVESPYFIGRWNELNDLVHTLGSMSENKVVLGIRRVGKSCLIHNALRAIRTTYPGVLCGKINCRGIGSHRSLADEIVLAALQAYKDEALVRGWTRLRGHLASRRIAQAIDAVNAIEFTAVQELFRARIELHERSLSEEQFLRRAFQFLREFTTADRQLVLALDEFQELEKLPGDIFQHFKAASDSLPNVRFVFSGSSLGLLEKVFLRPDSPLYLMAGKMHLAPLPDLAVEAFVGDRLQLAGIEADKDTCLHVHTRTGGIPYYVQKLGLLMWIRALQSRMLQVTTDDVDAAFEEMLREVGGEFESRLEHKYGPLQKDILRAISEGFHRRRDIATAIDRPEGQLSAALRSMEAGQVIFKAGRGVYEIADPVFQEWLRRL